MAGPSIPTNFYLQQANSQVLVSWDIMAGATSYIVKRSTDGVSYSSVGTPSVNYYLDTTVTVNTQYYYQVASTDGSTTSSYTVPQSIIPTGTGKLSLGELRTLSLMRADRVGTQFVTVPELNTFINQAYFELYDLLTTTYEDYNVKNPPYSFTTDGSNYLFALPSDFYKLLGVDLALNGSSNNYVTLKNFNFISRNRYVFPQITANSLGIFNLRYRMMGNNIMFIPTPSSGQTIRLWYVPRMTELLQDTDVLDGISGWDQYVIIRAAKYVLDKEESDTTKLDQELIFLKTRIEESAQNRDAGEPNTISDTRLSSQLYGGYPQGDGSWGGQ